MKRSNEELVDLFMLCSLAISLFFIFTYGEDLRLIISGVLTFIVFIYDGKKYLIKTEQNE